MVVGERESPFIARIKELEQYKRELYSIARSYGFLDMLTPKQQHILAIRGYSEEGRIRTFKELWIAGELQGNTPQSASDRERSAFRRVEELTGKRSVRRKIQMGEEAKQFLLGNPELPAFKAALELERDPKIVTEWRDLLGIPRGREGRPTKNIPLDTLEDLYNKKGFTIEKISKIFGCSKKTVEKKLDQFKILRRGKHVRVSRQHNFF